MKKVLIILILLLLCGCTSTYELDISNGIFKENINIVLPNDAYNYEPFIDPETGAVVEDDNQYKSFLEGDQPALFSGKGNYKKTVTEDKEYANVNLKYNYSETEFANSYALKMCFENSDFSYKPTYHIRASGYFYCLYSDKLDIVINAKDKVLKHNADEVVGTKYIWHIDNSNRENVNIDIEVKKGISIYTIATIVVAVIVLIIIYFLWKVYKKRNEQNNLV